MIFGILTSQLPNRNAIHVVAVETSKSEMETTIMNKNVRTVKDMVVLLSGSVMSVLVKASLMFMMKSIRLIFQLESWITKYLG